MSENGCPGVPRRGHHGRKRPLGRSPRLRPRLGPCARRPAGDRDRQGLSRPRGHPPHALRLLDRELAAADRRGRGADEIFGRYILAKMDGLRRNDVRVRFIGMRDRVPARLSGLMEAMEARTRDCRGLNLSIAIDYGGRDELTRAVRALSRQVEEGRLRPGGISEAAMAAALDTARAAGSGSHHPDLGRAQDIELPALAGRLRRVRLSRASPGRTSPFGISGRRSRGSGCGSAASAAPTSRSRARGWPERAAPAGRSRLELLRDSVSLQAEPRNHPR